MRRPAPGGRHRPAGPALDARRGPAALAGLLAAAVALGTAELAAGLVGPPSSPVVAVGDVVIARAPGPVTRWAIATFGGADKTVLVGGTVLLVAGCAAGLGVLALRHPRAGAAGVVLLGGLGAVAALTGPAGSPLDVLPSLVGAGAGVLALRLLADPLTAPPAAQGRAGAGLDRRRFLLTAGAALVAGGSGRFLQQRLDVAGDRSGLTLPAPASPAPPRPPGADLARRVDGLTPLVTGNRDFYRIDTALTVPQIRPAEYRLAVTGMVAAPRTHTLRDLLDRDDLIERDATLTCVSNEVGGRLAGTARWLGVPLGAFLREHGVSTAADQLVCRSGDGMTIGAPTRAALDVGDAMLALGMNGEPLPVEHGFPVRMVIPGLYGYVSACKWLVGIEAATFAAFDAFWVQRGWAAAGPIRISSRIDTPAAGDRFPAGRRAIAGVAWAQTRGIAAVEVRVDDGGWLPADLSPEVDADVWRQWVLPHDFAPGVHRLAVRATGADGEVQTDVVTEPFPAGATGLHAIDVTAT
ncbi:molybdopterin-dependent oxidoreductase [Geodermatophilus ruber]|uniref:DMSO/TMAO reductase YedYZ, molybdopterin-dependent catalytic subunit n=1 Tax=Geodermatophilus ruber TaxID=504800 RepID=A0A1I3Z4Z0_9ACTN|nr:molybdopterin-dependent oxidoreductase [Geodermatophilus ruber]SFK39183.1 DMSO/TMAO reductase YedYZ, molybdopterin-dependent catalytic subunit [Geodermatophilus ruber]